MANPRLAARAGPTHRLALTGAEVARYTRVLGVTPAEPSPGALQQLVHAHLCRVPFENLSKLWRARTQGRRGLPDLDVFLEGVERYHFGGTCYANNFHFHRLLRALGYDASLYGADMASGHDVHVAIRVRLEKRDLLVDVGYAAPFYEPLPLDLPSAYALTFGRDCYVLHPSDAEGRTRLELFREGVRVHGYLLGPQPRSIEHFERAVHDSCRDSSTFMRSLLLVRFFDSQSVTIVNCRRIDSTRDGSLARELLNLDQVVDEVVGAFDIDEPIVREAVGGLTDLVSP
jgi:N-hydroxyarylamine O-acetyltransferase